MPALSSNRLESDATRFCSAVESGFAFLVADFSFRAEPCQKEGFENWQSVCVVKRYLNSTLKIGVQSKLEFAEANLSLAIVELESGCWPARVAYYGHAGYARGITLDSLVEVLTNGETRPVIPHHEPGLKMAEMKRRMETARKLISEDMEGLIQTLAERCIRYASDILHGDLSVMDKVIEFHRKKYWGDAPL